MECQTLARKKGYMEKICHSENNNENKEAQMLFQLRSRKSIATGLGKKKR